MLFSHPCLLQLSLHLAAHRPLIGRPPLLPFPCLPSPGIRLDKHMRPKLDTEKTRSLVSLSPIRGRVRHEEAIRISRENLRIGQRLQTQQGMYSSAEFRRIANTQETYLDNCRKFRPSGYYSRSSTPSLEGGRYRGASPFPSTGAASMPTLSPRALDRQSRGEPNV